MMIASHAKSKTYCIQCCDYNLIVTCESHLTWFMFVCKKQKIVECKLKLLNAVKARWALCTVIRALLFGPASDEFTAFVCMFICF